MIPSFSPLRLLAFSFALLLTPPTLVSASSRSPQERASLFTRANALFQKGRYSDAIPLYESLLAEPGFRNFALLYNLGNAYFRLGRYGHALASYRSAQSLRPHHEDLLHNIQLIFRRLQKPDPSAGSGFFHSLAFLSFLTSSQLFWLTVFLFWLTFAWAAVHLRLSPSSQKQSLGWLAFLSLLAILAFGAFSWRLWQDTLIQRAVVTAPKVAARSGYDPSFEALFVLSEADEIQIHASFQGWRRISFLTTDSEKRRIRRFGWLPHDSIRPF